MWYRKNVRLPEVNPVLQYVLFVISTLYWLVGLGLTLIGIYACVEKDLIIKDFSNLITDPAIVILCFGSGLFFLTFFACVGALRENICMLQFFSTVLTISLLVQVASGFLILLLSDKVEKVVEEYFLVMIKTYRDDLDKQNVVDWGQQKFQCCGAKGYGDWTNNIYFNCSSTNPSMERCSVPFSCCVDNEPHALDANEIVYTNGCIYTLTLWIHDHIFILACLAVALAVPQIIGICISRILALQIKDQLHYMKLSGQIPNDT